MHFKDKVPAVTWRPDAPREQVSDGFCKTCISRCPPSGWPGCLAPVCWRRQDHRREPQDMACSTIWGPEAWCSRSMASTLPHRF